MTTLWPQAAFHADEEGHNIEWDDKCPDSTWEEIEDAVERAANDRASKLL